MSGDFASPDDDRFDLIDDEGGGPSNPKGRPWKVLVVDDEDDVHQATRFALRDMEIFGRPVELLHARSRQDALAMIGELGDVAVALVDVVMEEHDSGLELVRDLRAAGLDKLRIVLRTGHPGYAPERTVIDEYEIDDYRTKGELTRRRLVTVLTACIRTYEHLRVIERGRDGLELIIESSNQLFRRTNLELFSQGVLTQVAGLLDIAAHGIVISYPLDEEPGDLSETVGRVISATGHFAHLMGKLSTEVADPVLRERIETAVPDARPLVRDGYMTLHFTTDDGRGLIVLLETDLEISQPDLDLLKLFSNKISLSFENLALVEKLDNLAYVDTVLNVPNLNAFERALEKRFETSPLGNLCVALADIESYRTMAATYGFAATQKFLKEIYGDLNTDGRVVARLDDGVFAILAETEKLDADWLEAVLTKPRRIDAIEFSTAATSAILDLADIERDPGTVLRAAKSALLHVRQAEAGKTVRYDLKMRADAERRVMLQSEMRRAIGNFDGFEVHLQPIVDLQTGELKSAEALLRWTLDGEAVAPGEFIPIAESAGLTGSLTDFVLETVGAWSIRRKAGPALPVSVNLSMEDLNRSSFLDHLLETVRRTGLTPETVSFEVTEGVAMHHDASAQSLVGALREKGFRIALDDFGTGYSSLAQFDRLPIDTIKIDRAFVKDLDTPNARRSMASIVLGMSETLDVGCVAEGIETEEQKQALIFLGCKTGQGFLLGRPTPIAEFDARFA